MGPRHTARGIVLHQGTILLIERWRLQKHYFSVPGGGIEAGETAEEAAVRELLEETSCIVSLERLLYKLQLDDGTDHSIFLCNYISGDAHLPADSPEATRNDASNRFEPIWLPTAALADAPFLVWEPIRQQLVQDLDKGFSESLVTLQGSVLS